MDNLNQEIEILSQIGLIKTAQEGHSIMTFVVEPKRQVVDVDIPDFHLCIIAKEAMKEVPPFISRRRLNNVGVSDLEYFEYRKKLIDAGLAFEGKRTLLTDKGCLIFSKILELKNE